MNLEINEMVTAAPHNQERLNSFAKSLRREGKVLDRFDKHTMDGFRSGFFIEHEGCEYVLRMLNGNTVSIRKLWVVEG